MVGRMGAGPGCAVTGAHDGKQRDPAVVKRITGVVLARLRWRRQLGSASMPPPLLPFLFVVAVLPAAVAAASSTPDVSRRLQQRSFPAVFQAWNPIDMPAVWPLATNEGRLRAAAKHDVLWEEPVSQLGFNTPLVLGAVWDHRHGGLATRFTPASEQQALANRTAMLRMNPDLVFLLEVRWRDAPGSFLPEDSPFWKRQPDGSRVLGWDNGPEPYYLLDPENPAFRANIARQSRAALASGVYDGVMIDWSGHLGVVQDTRAALGPDALIIVNIHDKIADAEKYRELINGSFLECNPDGPGQPTKRNGTTWDALRAGYLHMEQHLRAPRLNCLEVWGDRKDLRRMRAATTLTLTHGDGAVLFGDPNPLKTPDHLHDWYDFWDVPLGRPLGPRTDRPDGASVREFTGGTVVYNHYRNAPATVRFETPRRRVSDGTRGTDFTIQDADGDIFVPIPR